MDQLKLDGKPPKRAWFGRVWGRLWPWNLKGWLWTVLFFALITALIVHIKALEAAHNPSAEKWWLAFPVLVVVYLIVAYRNSEKI